MKPPRSTRIESSVSATIAAGPACVHENTGTFRPTWEHGCVPLANVERRPAGTERDRQRSGPQLDSSVVDSLVPGAPTAVIGSELGSHETDSAWWKRRLSTPIILFSVICNDSSIDQSMCNSPLDGAIRR